MLATLLYCVILLGTALIAHSYVSFPLVLRLLYRRRAAAGPKFSYGDRDLPHVDVILAAHNESKVIEKKITSTFECDYPLDKLRLYVGSDASTDETDAIIGGLERRYDRLIFRPFSTRTGKPGVVETLVSGSQAPVLILTDANVFFDRKTIFNLVRHFLDPSVGLVGGNIVNPEVRRAGISTQEKAYLGRENLIKHQEGAIWGSMIGAFGGCFAIRRANYHPAPRTFLVDDFYVSMAVLRDGLRSINDLDAVCYEDVSDRLSEEFRRKCRIAAGNFQNFWEFRDLLWPIWSGRTFAFWSHKVLRWVTPHILIVVLATAIALVVLRGGPLPWLLLAAQLAFPLGIVADAVLRRMGMHVSPLRFITHFYSMNVALLVGHVRYLRGIRSTVWTPTERFQHAQTR